MVEVLDGVPVGVLPPPEPELTPDDLIARARAMRGRLRDEQAATEERTYPSRETAEEFRDAGFYRILQPRKFGGYEFTLPAFYRTVIEIAQGCPASAWCLSLGAGHVLTLATLFSEDAQAAAFGTDGHFAASARAVPSGRATRTGDGWSVTGRWDYSSGVPYATHVINSVLITGADGEVQSVGLALIPRDRIQIVEDWGDIIGMRGSGSHTVVADGAKVPGNFVADVDFMSPDPSKVLGHTIHGNPMYGAPQASFAGGELASVAIGLVYAALEEFADLSAGKTTMWPPGGQRTEDPRYLEWAGTALALADSAEATLLRSGELFHEWAEEHVSGRAPFHPGKDMRLMAMTGQASRLAVEAMDLIIRVCGSSAMKNGARMQRYWRDMTTFRGHLTQTLRETTLTVSGSGYLSDIAASRRG